MATELTDDQVLDAERDGQACMAAAAELERLALERDTARELALDAVQDRDGHRREIFRLEQELAAEWRRAEKLKSVLAALRRAVGGYAAQHLVDRCGCIVCDTTRHFMAEADAVLGA